MLQKFISKPVLSTVISIIIVILGLLGLFTLPISQYPDIAPPTVEVTASYQGANADVVRNSVLIPLEEQINGVENMQYMTSTAGNDGSATITIYFDLGTDPDLAAMNVQNRVNKANSLLPEEVIRAGVSTSKKQTSLVYIFSLHSTKDTYDQNFLQNYVNLNILPKLKRVNGIGDAFIYGARDYSMRIWLKPDVMASYGLVPNDVIAKLRQQNIEAAPGKFGVNGDQAFQYTIKYKGRLQTASEFGNIIVRADKDGHILRLDDIAKVELGALSYGSSTTTQGYPSTSIAVSQTAGSNAYELINECQRIIEESSKDFPSGIEYSPFLNANEFLNASIEKVEHTLIEAFILVFIVVFIFLQDFRSTLIPAISVPVAIVGTFFFLKVFGFTINLLTLFALVLAIGIVVDDAIVVVEAVHAKLDEGAKSARKATLSAMSEISSAIVSITLVMAAVFVPVSFIGGSAGVFYKQFGLTLAIAIVISAVNALTLSPALCAIFLKPHSEDHHKRKTGIQRFYAGFNIAFNAITAKYVKGVQFLLKRKWLALGSIAAFSVLSWFLIKNTPTGFVPAEDSRAIFGNVILPPSASLERTEALTDQIDSIIRTVPEVESSTRMAGQDLISGAGGSYGAFFIRLKDWEERAGEGQDIESVVNNLFNKTSGIKGANIIFFAAPTLQGFGNTNGFEFNLQDRTANDMDQFSGVVQNYLGAINQRPEILYATTSFNNNFPQFELEVDIAKCEMAGITPDQVLAVMQGYYGGIYASDFNRFNKQYRVMVQSDPVFSAKPEDLHAVMVKTVQGEMVPITQFVTLKKVYGSEFIRRFNLYTSANVTGVPAPGYSSGDAVKAIQEVADENLPKQFGYEFAGLSREEVSSGSQTVYIFILCLVFVYFLLAAQYESYILPFSVLLPLPFGLSGAFLFAKLFGIDNNIFLQISLIMLIGLLAKNSILIVEFALMHRKNGESLFTSAVEGARARLRPILMTSFAFIFGLVPLMLASGAGAVSNRSIGTAAVGGMLTGTLFGIFVIPALFMLFQSLQEKVSGKPATNEE
ncbi:MULTISPECIES: efflux RND transporter permease subunit [Leeuwenhoekiella]|jgi:HAE1 family hydrophobic/amphiphilic exporter-1|uniref:efflux RND transporter permease subunit n=1 Tax=Leeuwenhoekiella TaxID=283735 RepID=UPI000C64D435|nr:MULTISPECIES: efflux RND transporter permease subunit [Leeuwenhoekiella]MAO43206.1 hydrophobe/amphiphile efflux-1 family RND transporter [Leeuwenhoekiella sp.]MBQ50810.1 hydrophobe/amphiphile efflux-1 family RND transporter [Leeuwenhoekiella sp.]|tara:strand:- start:63558 stop:66689 length:3132 start_codon:yes stop_codon:yes gene_type:complete